jgi:pyrimidine-nucleoside phosphorylase
VDYVDLIERKKDAEELTASEIRQLVDGYMSGEVADYQMSAWLMAVVLNGLTLEETIALADAEVDSGDRLDLSSLGRPVIDKHSTGGVGDKVTLVLAPLVAACGAVFGKMSGRGLGHTGGTIDKLESIPGFRTELDADVFRRQLESISLCVAGQSANLVPADKMLYALRDVTATVDSNPLVAASIMSKKIASGSSAVVIDIKVGRGAFLKNRGQAAGVFHLMKAIGEARGVTVKAVMTPMQQPLGSAAGNSVEVLEAVETLRGNGPGDLVEVVTRLAALALAEADLDMDEAQAAAEAAERLSDGSALEKFVQWIEAQGGDTSFIDDAAALPAASLSIPLEAKEAGYIADIDALEVGKALVELGAGRLRKDEMIDPAVGLLLHRKAGDAVAPGDVLAEVLANDRDKGEVAALRVSRAFSVTEEKPEVTFKLEEL